MSRVSGRAGSSAGGRFSVNHGWVRIPSTGIRRKGSAVKIRLRRSLQASLTVSGMAKRTAGRVLSCTSRGVLPEGGGGCFCCCKQKKKTVKELWTARNGYGFAVDASR